jgi:hypothetical protein
MFRIEVAAGAPFAIKTETKKRYAQPMMRRLNTLGAQQWIVSSFRKSRRGEVADR